MTFKNYTALKTILGPIESNDMSGVLGWGGGHGNLKHNQTFFKCPHCQHEATLTENVARKKDTVVGFRKESIPGRSFIVGFLIIECPQCQGKYTIHTGTPSIMTLIDMGAWPLGGLKKEYHAMYTAVFPQHNPK